MSFVERALPLPAPSVASSHSQDRDGGRGLETPPSRPVWETRQPLKGVSQEGRYPAHDASLDSQDMYQEQQNILGNKIVTVKSLLSAISPLLAQKPPLSQAHLQTNKTKN